MTTDEIIIGIRAGKTELYADLVGRFQDDVWRLGAAMLGDVNETEDIVQQAFVQAFLKLDQFQRNDDFGAWVKQIARNVVRQRLRADSRESRRLFVYRDRLAARLDDPRASDHEDEYLEALEACRKTLPERQDRILGLYYRDNLSFSEIADKLQSSVDAVTRTASRSRLALRDCIQRRMARI